MRRDDDARLLDRQEAAASGLSFADGRTRSDLARLTALDEAGS